jgi:hypothetical protein
MRSLIPILFFSAVAGASTLTVTRVGAAQAGDDPAAATAAEVEELRGEIDSLRAELDETRALLDETVHFLHENAKAAKAMAAVLDASEKEGFTFGINPRSREVLLEGWRKNLSAQQKSVPGKPAEEPAEQQPARRTFGG